MLAVPAMPCVIEGGVFDAWSWCASDTLAWWHHGLDVLDASSASSHGPVDTTNPPSLVFLIHDVATCAFLPRELACLHARGFGLGEDAWALAPYGIDDATDLLYEHRTRPRDALTLLAPSLPALVWGLHDWAHFHNHGPFDDPPTTELGCDLVALAWLRHNRTAVGLDEAALARVATSLAEVTRRRFADAGRAAPCDVDALFAAPYPEAIVVRTP
jgi:hypothetical protein